MGLVCGQSNQALQRDSPAFSAQTPLNLSQDCHISRRNYHHAFINLRSFDYETRLRIHSCSGRISGRLRL